MTTPNHDENHEIRKLKWRLKSLGKQLGRAGQVIHLLRAELAETREINGKIARGHVRELERTVASQATQIAAGRAQNTRLLADVRGLRERQGQRAIALPEPVLAHTYL